MSIVQQIKCKTHPTEYITNYCYKDTCFAQLCATCICEHTQFHNRSGTRPEYQNIKETFLKTNENLNKFKESLSKQKARIKKVLEGIQTKRKQVQKMFKQAKEDVLSIVERTFIELQRDYNQQLTRQKQKTGLLNETKLDEILAQINKRSLEAYSITQELNNMRQISNIKKVNTEFLPKSIEFKNQICHQITSNELFQPNVTYKSCYLEEVSGALKRLMTISFSYPVNGEFKQNRTPASKTPSKDQNYQTQNQNQMQHQAYHQPPLNVVINGRPSAILKIPQQLKSPNKYEEYNNQTRVNMRSTNKQNFWHKPEPMIKTFQNTTQF